jgi:hypothetical protein
MDGKKLRSKTEDLSGLRTKAGERPGGLIGREMQVTADVTKVNIKAWTITLRGPGHRIDLNVGDQDYATYTAAVALAAE